jgi:hypothetical protein
VASALLHVLLLLCRLGLPGFLQPAASPCPPKLLAWHCNQQQLAIGHAGSGAVLLYDLSTAASGGDAGGGVVSQAQQVLTHQLQQQVRAPAAEAMPSDMHACVYCPEGVLGRQLHTATAAIWTGLLHRCDVQQLQACAAAPSCAAACPACGT